LVFCHFVHPAKQRVVCAYLNTVYSIEQQQHIFDAAPVTDEDIMTTKPQLDTDLSDPNVFATLRQTPGLMWNALPEEAPDDVLAVMQQRRNR
jgi:hypothetical protein